MRTHRYLAAVGGLAALLGSTRSASAQAANGPGAGFVNAPDLISAMNAMARKGAAPGSPGGHTRGGGDECAGATPISGTGTFPFDSTVATGSPGQPCGDVGWDVWFRWTPVVAGAYAITTCDATLVDTVLVFYSGPCDALATVTCNDDDCGVQSRIVVTVAAGTPYSLRVGTYAGDYGGTGTFTISAVDPPAPPCSGEPAGHCQAFIDVNGYTSNPDAGFIVHEDFQLATSASVTGLCFRGGYLGQPTPDAFAVSYYTDEDRSPGTLIATFDGAALTVQSAPTGGEMSGYVPEFEYNATHAPVALAGGACYFVSITNSVGPDAAWYWEQSFWGNRFAVQNGGCLGVDMGLCLHQTLGPACPAPHPAGDDCADAQPIAAGSSVSYSTECASTDGPVSTCAPIGADVWFRYVAAGTGEATADTCASDFDSVLVVYNACGGPELACIDDACGRQARLTFGVSQGQAYLIRIGGFVALRGSGTLTLAGPSCRADVNGDGAVNISDFLAFLQLYAAGDPRADINGTGGVNVQDFLAFLQLFAAGC
jgi:hypothetical protein